MSTVYKSEAQILPPDFLCLKGDTLMWNPTPNPCGPFLRYNIYVSDNRQGPYMILTQITDQTQTDFFHTNPSDLTRYYYLETVHDCPGEPRVPSDTLDNRAPVITEISSASVENGGSVRIRWEANESPETEGYIIYRETPIGTIPIDTVFGSLEYLDTDAQADMKSEVYYVLALDPCGNTSLFGAPHRTIFMTGTLSECTQEINLEWNGYENWPQGVEQHEIWIGIDGSSPVPVDTIAGTDTSYSVLNTIDNAEYCIFVKAISERDGFEAVTNRICMIAEVIQPVTDLYIKNLDVQADGKIETTWIWNDDAQLASAELILGIAPQTNLAINPSFPLSRENSFIIDSPTGDQGVLNVRIATVDDCDTSGTSAIGRQIYLTAQQGTGLSNELAWTALEIENLTVESYEVLKSDGGTAQSAGQVNGSIQSFSDQLAPGAVSASELCYFVRASSVLTHPDGMEETVISNSNQVCLSPSAKIFMPNAFSPRGRNQVFKPVLSYGVPKAYKMVIFNRWGEIVFESDEIGDGWNGKIGSRDAPATVYTYLIQMTQQDGTSENMSGSVALIR